jgi:hypothetical protein
VAKTKSFAGALGFNEVQRRLPRLRKTEVELRPELTVGNEIDFGRLVTGKNDDQQRLQKTKLRRDA